MSALANVQAALAQLQTDVNALVAEVQNPTVGISASDAANLVATINTIDVQVKAVLPNTSTNTTTTATS